VTNIAVETGRIHLPLTAMNCQLKRQPRRRMPHSTDCGSLLEHTVETESFVPRVIRRAEGRHIGIELEKFVCRISKSFFCAEWWGKVRNEVVFDHLFRGNVNGDKKGS
jgi:hypothetical protein